MKSAVYKRRQNTNRGECYAEKFVAGVIICSDVVTSRIAFDNEVGLSRPPVVPKPTIIERA